MIWLLASLAFAEIVVEPPPAAGVETAVTVLDDLSRPISGATVRAVARPGLDGERDLAVGLTDNRGRVYWTPGRGGPYLLQVRTETKRVHVAYDGADNESMVLLIALGIIGLLASVIGLWPRRRESSTS